MLMGQTPLQQLLRLPIFVQHLREHRAEDPGISIAAFVVEHYFSGNPVDDDYDRDMQLPFRAHDVVLISSTVVPNQVELPLAPPSYDQKVYPLLPEKDLQPSYPFSVFQPPRFS